MGETKRLTCHHDCPDTCGIIATVEDGKVTRLKGDPDHPITRGFLCYRTNHYLSRHYDPNRLQTPMLRTNGSHKPVSWNEALDHAAEQLTRIKEESGPAAIFHYRGGGSIGQLQYLSDYFFELLGPVTTQRGSICSGAGNAAQEMDFGSADSSQRSDIENAKSIVLWGKNVFTSSPHTIPMLKSARERGARITLIDPVHNRTATLADRFIQCRAGHDFSIAMAAVRVATERGWLDDKAPEYCDHYDEFMAMAQSRTLESWCADADITVDEATYVAECFGPHRPCSVLVGWGLGRHTFGGASIRGIDALATVTGNVGVSGGGVSYNFQPSGAFDIPGGAEAPRSICEPLFGKEVLAADDPPIRAIWITGANPVVNLPESDTLARALRTRDFVVATDHFMTDTAREADLVLPATSMLEADDIYDAYGHHFLGVTSPVIPRTEGVRSDLEIAQELANRMGFGDKLAGSATDWKRRIITKAARDKGVTVEALAERSMVNPLSAKTIFEGHKFQTESGRMNLIASTPYDENAIEESGEFPLQLMAHSTRDSQCSQWVEPPRTPFEVTVHPESANGIEDGAECTLESRHGKLRIRVRHDEHQRKDIALMPKGGPRQRGACANVITEARLTDLGEGGDIYSERVRIVA